VIAAAPHSAVDWAQVVDFMAVALFGALVGAGELVAGRAAS
jgi:hypothetical protein